MQNVFNRDEATTIGLAIHDTKPRRLRGGLLIGLMLGIGVLSGSTASAERDPSFPEGSPQAEIATGEGIEAADAVMIAQIKGLLTTWGAELELWRYGEVGHYSDLGGHSNFMASLYDANAELLPTVSPGVWKTPGNYYSDNCVNKTIASYFGCKFLTKKPKMIARSDESVMFSPDLKMATNQGLYTFELTFTNRNNVERRLTVRARFTFVYKKGTQADWSDAKIILHHSSGEPGFYPFAGDVNGDGFVDFLDVTTLLTLWRPS